MKSTFYELQQVCKV
jgi:hypothetical protein